jgi:hypothetical protein
MGASFITVNRMPERETIESERAYGLTVYTFEEISAVVESANAANVAHAKAIDTYCAATGLDTGNYISWNLAQREADNVLYGIIGDTNEVIVKARSKSTLNRGCELYPVKTWKKEIRNLNKVTAMILKVAP